MLGNTTSITVTDAPSPATFRLSPAPRRTSHFGLHPSHLVVGRLAAWSFLKSWPCPILSIFTFFQMGCQNMPKDAKTCQKGTCQPLIPVAQTFLSAGSRDIPVPRFPAGDPFAPSGEKAGMRGIHPFTATATDLLKPLKSHELNHAQGPGALRLPLSASFGERGWGEVSSALRSAFSVFRSQLLQGRASSLRARRAFALPISAFQFVSISAFCRYEGIPTIDTIQPDPPTVAKRSEPAEI